MRVVIMRVARSQDHTLGDFNAKSTVRAPHIYGSGRPYT